MIYILRAQFHLVNCTMWRQVSKTIANNCQINYWQLRDRCGNLSADALSRSRGVWWYAHVLPATRIDVSLRPATACCCSDCVLLFYSLRLTVPSANSAVRPPKETALARSHTLSHRSLANLLSPDHQPPATANCLQPCLLGLQLTLSYPIIGYTRHATPFHRLWHHKIIT